jgi:hypothetical protein
LSNNGIEGSILARATCICSDITCWNSKANSIHHENSQEIQEREKLRHSPRPKIGGGGDATTQQCNGEIETSKKRKINKNKK